jgi:hypothetical protein
MFVTYSDSVVIYDITGILDPERLSMIRIEPPVSWVSPVRFHTSAGPIIEGSMYVKTTYGINIFDISDVTDPVRTNYIYGLDASLLNHTSNYYLMSNTADPNNPYSGINKIDIITGIHETNTQVLDRLWLSQNYPNPFNPVTRIRFTIPRQEKVELAVYDILGRKVIELLNRTMPAGMHQVEFNGEGMASGLYFYIIRAGNYKDIKKMVLIK